MNEDQILLIKLLTLLRATELANKIADIMPDSFTEDDFKRGIKAITKALEEKSHQKIMVFNDENHFCVQKFSIKTFSCKESVEGFPTIVLNEFMPDNGKGGIGERTLYYEDENLRDKDIEKLCFMLS